MRIFVDAHVLDGSPQGTTSYVAGLYRALAQLNEAKLYIATRSYQSVEKYFSGVQNIEWVALKSENSLYRLGLELPKLEKSISPNFSHYNYICPSVKSSYWINTIHDILFLDQPKYFPLSYRAKRSFLFNISARRADIIITDSDYSRRTITDRFGLPESKVYTIPIGVDSYSTIKPVPVEDIQSKKFLLYVSRFEPRKNQHQLIEEFEAVSEGMSLDVKLLLVGYPSVRYPKLEKIIKDKPPKLLILSGLSDGQLKWLYMNAIAAVYPSNGEGFGLPVIEAVAAGGISYCAENTALNELKNYVHGTFNNDEVGDLTRVLSYLLSNDKKNHQEKQSFVLRDFNWMKAAERFVSVLQDF